MTCPIRFVLLLVLSIAALPEIHAQGSDEDLRLYEKQVFELINTARRDRGLGGLEQDDDLQSLADDWALRLASTGEFRHRPDLLARASALGFISVTENVWRADQPLPGERVVDTWLESPDHARNLMSSASTHGAVAAARGDSGRLVVVFEGGRRFRIEDF